MDYLVPDPDIPTGNVHLSPSLRVFDQWIRLTIGSALAFTVLAPPLRSISLRMAETEHRRQNRFIPPPEGPFLPYSSVREAAKQTWKQEGYRGFFRGMGALYATTPIRAAYHLLLFDLVDNERITMFQSDDFASTSRPDQDHPVSLYQTREDGAQSRQLQTPIPYSNKTPQPTLLSLHNTSKPSFLLKSFGLILAGELLLYPARYLFVRMSGDLLGDAKTIPMKLSSTLLQDVIRREGVLALYRGFLPCLLAISIPALLFADHRYMSKRAAKPLGDPKQPLVDPSKSVDGHLGSISDASRSLSVLEYSKLLLAFDRSHTLSSWDAIVSAKEKKNGDNTVSRAWILSTIISYPLICTHIRMVVGNQSRVPNPKAWKWLPVDNWPRMRALAAAIFPSSSTAFSAGLQYSLRRIMLPGATSVFTAIWAALATRLAFDSLTGMFAVMASWPLNVYQNLNELGTWSVFSLSYNEAILEQKSRLEAERVDTRRGIAQALDHRSGFDDEVASGYALVPSIGAIEHAEVMDDSRMMRYRDGDDSLIALGFTPVKRRRDYLCSTDETTAQALSHDPLADLDLNAILAEKPSERATRAPSAGIDAELGNGRREGVDGSTGGTTKQPQEKEGKPKPKSMPLLSQPQPWFSQFHPTPSKNQL